MKRLALVLLPLVLGSCRENRASVTVQDMCYPTKDCTFTAKCDQVIHFTPTVDVQITGYRALLALQVENQLADNSDKTLGRTNTNDAHVSQIAIDYSGVAMPRSVVDVGNTRIPTGGTSVIFVDVIRNTAENRAALDAALGGGAIVGSVAKIKLRGYFDDGSSFETGDFSTALTLCEGCLLSVTPRCAAGETACFFEGMDPVACGTSAG